jgi:hypothetical protein
MSRAGQLPLLPNQRTVLQIYAVICFDSSRENLFP